MSNYLLIFSLILYSVLSPGQSAPSWPGSCYQGYSASLKGGRFSYHSSQPDVTTSMLIRATDSSQYIEWQTESLPAHLCKPDSVGVEESVTAVQEEAIIRGKDRKYRSVLFQFVHLGDPEPSEIHVDPDQITSFILNPFISSPGSSITTGQPTSLPVKRVN